MWVRDSGLNVAFAGMISILWTENETAMAGVLTESPVAIFEALTPLALANTVPRRSRRPLSKWTLHSQETPVLTMRN